MLQIIELEGWNLAVQAESVQPVAGGYLLSGAQVAVFHDFGPARFYRHGFHSWSLSAWLHPSARLPRPVRSDIAPQIDSPELLAAYPHASSGLGALECPDGRVLLLGALELDAQVTNTPPVLRGAYAPGVTETAWFLAFGHEESVFFAYTKLLAGRRGVRGTSTPARVWCSWYAQYTAITQESILAALHGLSATDESACAPFDVFQIDDGWQISHGDWVPNYKFAGGMDKLAMQIHEQGFTPGIWLAPFIVQPKSSLFQAHPEWLLHDADGRLIPAGHNWGDWYYALDVTHPEVIEWLKDLMRTVCAWGYRYLKLDFLFAASLPGVRHTPMPPEAAFRAGLQTLRDAADQAAGGQAYILACGAPVLASLGLADGIRVGPDVAPFWDNDDRSNHLHDLSGPATLNGLRTTLNRLWLRPLIHIDPDVVFFRSRYNLMTPEQNAILQDMGLITGFKATSDLPMWLDPAERAALDQFLSVQPPVQRLSRYEFMVGERRVSYKFLEDEWSA